MSNIKVTTTKSVRNLVAKELTFPDGQPHIELSEYHLHKNDEPVVINARITSMDDLIKLCLVKEILDHNNTEIVSLILRYIPCRMDRRIHDGSPITIKAFANIINSLNFPLVNVYAPHSDVTLALLNRSNDMRLSEMRFYIDSVNNLIQDNTPLTILLPDVGAAKRFYEKYSPVLAYGKFVVETANKHRDMSTGKLTGFEVPKVHELGNRILILDDLCDGGGTFAGLADVIHKYNPRAEVFLAVHHGIFSKGLDIPGIAGIFTTDSFHDKEFFDASKVTCLEI